MLVSIHLIEDFIRIIVIIVETLMHGDLKCVRLEISVTNMLSNTDLQIEISPKFVVLKSFILLQ